MKRILIHGLKFRSFIVAIQRWPTQPSLTEFENLLAGQEALAKEMHVVFVKIEEEALYGERGKGKENLGQTKAMSKSITRKDIKVKIRKRSLVNLLNKGHRERRIINLVSRINRFLYHN